MSTCTPLASSRAGAATAAPSLVALSSSVPASSVRASSARSRSVPVPAGGRALGRLRGGRPEEGMATAEYAVATVAACGFGAVLIKAITDERVLSLIINVISKALRLGLG